MIEAGEFYNFEVLVATLFQRAADGRQILRRQHLFIVRTIDRQHRAGDFAQRDGRIVRHKITKPRRG